MGTLARERQLSMSHVIAIRRSSSSSVEMPSESSEKSFNKVWLERSTVNLCNVNDRINKLFSTKAIDDDSTKALWLLKAVSLIDLTTLAGDDTESNVKRLCFKAANPLPNKDYAKIFDNNIKLRTAAVCVYPSKVSVAYKAIERMGLSDEIQIAAVATGFPSGQYSLESRLVEIKYAVESGATEIDIVLDRSLVLSGQWEKLFEELVKMKEACANAHMKAILAIGELGTMENVYKASMVAMYAGSDFIKTSTGKEAVNATLSVGLVMCRAIRQYYTDTGIRVGLKPAGGIRTHKDAIDWMILVKEELGDEWLNSCLFRIGASGLLGDIERWFYTHKTGRSGVASDFAFI